MTDTELLKETNQLLKRLVEIDREDKVRVAESQKEHKRIRDEMEAKRKQSMREHLHEQGLSIEDAELSKEQWDERMKEAQKISREKIEASRKKELQFKEDLLEELRVQSELLRQIAEKLTI